MADSAVCAEPSGPKTSEFKCLKCNKKVKNGVQCYQCESNFHFKCGNVSGAPGELKWSCPKCDDKTSPVTLQEVRCQEIERAFFLLQGECATYMKLYEDLNNKYIIMVNEFDNLKKSNLSSSKDNNLKKSNSNPSKKHVAAPASNIVSFSDILQQGQSTHDNNQLANRRDQGEEQALETKRDKSLTVISNKDETSEPKTLDNGFVEVKKRQRRKPVIGNSSNSTLSASIPTKWLHVYRLQQATTVDQVLNYLKAAKSSVSFKCEALNARGDYASFKVGYPPDLHDEIIEPKFWPQGVAIRPFFVSRQKTGTIT